MTTWRSNINYVPTRPRRKVAYISDDSLGKVGFSFSAKAAQTEVGLGCLLCLLLFRVFVRPLRHSWPSSSSYTFECDVSLDKIVEVVTLPDVVVAVAVVSHGKTLLEESVIVTIWLNIGNKRKVTYLYLIPFELIQWKFHWILTTIYCRRQLRQLPRRQWLYFVQYSHYLKLNCCYHDDYVFGIHPIQ